MRLAIASSGKTLDSIVSSTFGRAPYLIIYENKKITEVVKNPFVFGGGGSGLGVVQMLEDKGVKTVIGGNFGLNVIESLNEKDMSYREVNNVSIRDAITRL